MFFRTVIFVLVATATAAVSAAPSADLWRYWDRSNEQSDISLNHTAWSDFLDQYLKQSTDGINRVAYKKVTTEDKKALKDYIQFLSAQDPRQLAKSEQLPYWINFYNALTVAVVLDRPKKRSILKMGDGFFSIGPWDLELATVNNQPLTLNDIEHRILRPIWKDHRIHYAVNCASLGCPNLAGVAYTRDNSEALLKAGEHDYINHERGVSFDNRGRLKLSKIFDWYGSDFATDKDEFLAYLAMHHTEHSKQLKNYDGRIKYDYDWSLNTAN